MHKPEKPTLPPKEPGIPHNPEQPTIVPDDPPIQPPPDKHPDKLIPEYPDRTQSHSRINYKAYLQ